MNDSAGESLNASFTDLMTSLMVIFILLLVAATNATVHQFQQEKGKSASNRDELIGNLRKAFPNLEIDKDLNDPLAVIVVLPEGLLFLTGSAVVPQVGQDFLQNFIPKFAGVVCATPNTVRSVVIEGHTDETGGDALNMKLSQNRANEVAESTLKLLSNSSSYGCFLEKMSASGRGKNDLIPTADKKSIDEDRSRRVEFHLRVPSFEQRNTAHAMLEATRQAAQNQASVVLKHE